MRLAERVAVITGAASGIGRGLSLALAKRGCHLALVDRDQAGLSETGRLIPGVDVSTHVLDVTDREGCRALPEQVLARHGRVDLLVNNAGVAIGGTFEQVDEADFDWLLEINLHAVIRLTRAFLPHLKASNQARIVNVSSLFGLIAPPRQTAYCTAKFAVRGFSESLRHELEEAGSTVGVTVVHPGGVNTGIARNARPPRHVTSAEAMSMAADRERFQAFLRLSPERAGEIIADGIERDRARIIVGGDAKVAALLERLFPVSHWAILKRRMR